MRDLGTFQEHLMGSSLLMMWKKLSLFSQNSQKLKLLIYIIWMIQLRACVQNIKPKIKPVTTKKENS